MRTQYEFVLPRGYVDESGNVHKRGVMRLATARDELEPLRDPTILGADDPRLTIVVLSRVVESLGTLPMVTRHEIEGLFAADLAYLQDFYGVINFGSEEDIDALLEAQNAQNAESAESGGKTESTQGAETARGPGGAGRSGSSRGASRADNGTAEPGDAEDGEVLVARPVGRRRAIEEVPSSGR